MTETAAWPRDFVWELYARLEVMNYPFAFMNSLVVTLSAIAGIVILSAMAAYHMVRYPHALNKLLFALFVSAMVIPFQSIMIPLMKVTSHLGLLNSRWGLVCAYFGFGVSLAIFLFHGFVKSIPREIEESAVVDGCTPYGVFWRIVFPLLQPMIATVVILNALWIWNDFLLPFLMVNSTPTMRTIPLSTFALFGEYTKQWDLAMAALVMGIAPIIIFFLALQKRIIEGITSGSVKG